MVALPLSPAGTSNPSLPSSESLELWGGIECTVNRVGDYFNDQLQWSGHRQRLEDLDKLASLGIKSLRYPILWENVARDGNLAAADWAWCDERLLRLRELDLRPIAGLTHHGSGPTNTNLLDPEFPSKLAEYAGKVASRYPWLEAYTPVNEPLTTARFSGLYGLWYPHAKSNLHFVQALLNECRATVLSMREIRKVNSKALLIQTEDLGKTHSTEHLAYQADFENARRWLTFDLLCGKVDQHHPLWQYLLWTGVEPAEVLWFGENACPPDIFGVNYYVTSERFLDHRVDNYPLHLTGGNDQDRYVDIEAVRVLAGGHDGIEVLLSELQARYRAPIAITECHLGCTREEQMRWFVETWRSAENLRASGVDVRAVTAWSLLGSYDWNSLLTRADGWYESGVYEMMSGIPKPTAMVNMLQSIGRNEKPEHPVLDSPGWWQRQERLHYAAVTLPSSPAKLSPQVRAIPRPILIIRGKDDTLGKAVALQCERRGLAHVLLQRSQINITEASSVAKALNEIKPWSVIDTAGCVCDDEAERDPKRYFAKTCVAPTIIAEECAHRDISFLTYSTDLVFDGSTGDSYAVPGRVNPFHLYDQSKRPVEEKVLEVCPEAIVVRTSAFFCRGDSHHFVYHSAESVQDRHTSSAFDDVAISSTHLQTLADRTLDLLIDNEQGVWRVSCEGGVTPADFGAFAGGLTGCESGLNVPNALVDSSCTAKRPIRSVLRSHKSHRLKNNACGADSFVAESECV